MAAFIEKKKLDFAGPHGPEPWIRIHGPFGKYVDVLPEHGLECKVVHRGNKNGFGVEVQTGNTKTVLHIGTTGATSDWLKSLQSQLPPPSNHTFWNARKLNWEKQQSQYYY